jgi:hypothetical protein
VGRATQGPIDTVETDRRGRFQFRFAADTTATFLVSARYAGIEYFSMPLATNPARPDTAIELLVHDTSSTVPIRVRSRTIVVGAPDAIGARTVIDWLVLANSGDRTRVAVDSFSGTWSGTLPTGVRNPQLGDPRLSQLSPEAVLFRGDSVLVLAPLSPGDKELLLQYEAPAALERLVLESGADSLDLFIEEPNATVTGPGWRLRDTATFEGRPFRRFHRVAREAGLVIDLPGTRVSPAVLPVLVGLTALGLIGATGYLLRRPAPARQPTATHLADQIALLDHEAAHSPDPAMTERLRLERVALVERLRSALARRQRDF